MPFAPCQSSPEMVTGPPRARESRASALCGSEHAPHGVVRQNAPCVKELKLPGPDASPTQTRQLDQFTAAVADSGEGRWTIEAALEEPVPADVLTAAVLAHFRSRDTQVFGEKLLSAMRFGFGGHPRK